MLLINFDILKLYTDFSFIIVIISLIYKLIIIKGENMFSKEVLEERAGEIEKSMQQMVQNYNVLMGQHAEIKMWLEKLTSGVSEIIEGVTHAGEALSEASSAIVDVVEEIGME